MFFNRHEQEQPQKQPRERDERFLYQAKRIDITLSVMEFAGYKFLALTTAFFSYGTISQYLSKQLSGFYYELALAAGILLTFLLIDFGISQLVRYYYQEKQIISLEKNVSKARKLFLNMILLFVILRVVSTTSTTLIGTPEVTELFTTNAAVKKHLAQIEKRDSLQQIKINQAQDLADRKKDEHQHQLEVAYKRATAIIEEAIASGDRWQRQSYEQEGLAWLTNRANPDKDDHAYGKRIRDAKVESERIQNEASTSTLSALSVVESAIIDSSNTAILATLTKQVSNEQAAFEARSARRTMFLYFWDILAAIFAIGATRMRVLLRAAGDDNFDRRSFTASLFTILEEKYQATITLMEEKIGVDINGDGTVGNTTQQGATMTVATVAKPVQVRGFQQLQQPTATMKQQPVAKTTTTTTATAKQQLQQQQKTPVPQAATPVAKKTQQTERIIETRIVTAPQIEVERWRKMVGTYYKRALIMKKNKTTGEVTYEFDDDKYDKYTELRDLLHATGQYTCTEYFNKKLNAPRIRVTKNKS